MSLHFLLGDAGDGKSSAIAEEIIAKAEANPEKRYLLLVPEQFCLSTQRRLTERHPRHALLNIEALSFDRLAARTFRELSAEARAVMTETEKQIELSLAIRDRLPQLTVYKKQALRPGFAARLSSLFAAWDMNDLSAARLGEIAEQEALPALLKRKLSELAGLYEAFRKRRGETITAEAVLPLFGRLLPRSRVGRVDELYLDGFTGFTAVQYRILETLMTRCGEMTLALTLPEDEDPDAWFRESGRVREDLYALSKETVWRLSRMAEKMGRKTDLRFYRGALSRRPEAAYLSAHLMRKKPGEPWKGDPAGIMLMAAESPRDEAELAAAHILKLVREEGLRYRDIALVVSDQNLYGPLLESFFEENGIPYFTDRRDPLSEHPLVRLLEDALDALEKGWERNAFLCFLKNPCGPLEPEETDRLENYMLAAGIRGGKKLEEPFSRLPKKKRGESGEAYALRSAAVLAEAETLRAKALAPLAELKNSLGKGRFTVSTACEALIALTDGLKAEERLSTLCRRLSDEGKKEKAESWEKTPALLKEMLERMSKLLGETRLNRREFADVLKVALSSLTAGKLPSSGDQILIGDVERSRFGGIRQLLFLGLNADLIPRPAGDGGLITDSERELLGSYEEDLGYTHEKALFEERFYIKMLTDLPRDGLYLSYARMDSTRHAKQPSRIVKEIRSLFPDLKELMGPREARDRWMGREAALRALSREFGGNEADWPLLYGLMKDDPQAREGLELIEQGASYSFSPKKLEKALAEKLFGRVLSGSVTRLENFAGCPYRHFLQYGLGTEEREELRWEASDHGIFFHAVLEDLLRRIKEEKIRVSAWDGEERRRQIRVSVDKVLEKHGDFLENDNAAYLLDRWQGYFDRYLKALGGYEEKSGFIPEAFELHFGRQEGTALRLPLSEGELSLQGTIDRLDIYEAGDTLYLRVVDYKTGDKSVDFGELDMGTQLQLPAYMTAALKLYRERYPDRKVLPGGLYYAVLKEKWLDKWTDPSKREDLERQLFRLSGLTAAEVRPVSGDAASFSVNRQGFDPPSSGLELVSEKVCRKLTQLGEEILDGNIAASPVAGKSEQSEYSSCTFCPYTALWDRKAADFAYRERKKSDPAAYLEEAKEALNGI